MSAGRRDRRTSFAWECGDGALDLGRARVMGVVNVTPDSFSDGGAHDGAAEAVAWGMRLLDEGADILDVGGESTRPGFTAVDPDQECDRVLPVIRELAAAGALVSVDTRHAGVAAAALEAGARIINDVSGFSDPSMVEVAAASGCGCVVMHAVPGSLGGPVAAGREAGARIINDVSGFSDPSMVEVAAASGCGCVVMHAVPGSLGGPVAAGRPTAPEAFVGDVERFLLERAWTLEGAGVSPARICLDAGPGFGTDACQDLAVQRATGHLSDLGYPYLCAVSRKRFVGALSGAHPAIRRDAASVGVALAAVAAGARIVRVHDVAATAEALRTFEACGGSVAPRRAFVALGANLGDRVAALRAAVEAIGRLPLTEVVAASGVYDTEPAYLDGQPSFANAVLEVQSGLHPIALLEALLSIEDGAGRVRTVANGPRPLDLDLLWMERESHAGSRLTLPHPLMGERSFVLRPLADLVGDAERFCRDQGIPVAPADARVGRVTEALGGLIP